MKQWVQGQHSDWSNCPRWWQRSALRGPFLAICHACDSAIGRAFYQRYRICVCAFSRTRDALVKENLKETLKETPGQRADLHTGNHCAYMQQAAADGEENGTEASLCW